MRSRLPFRGSPWRWAALAIAFLVLAGLPACDDTSKSPAPTSVASPSGEVIPGAEASPSPLIPGIHPNPTPTSTPTPAPTATPGPTPTPSPTPAPTSFYINIYGKDGTAAFSPNPASVKVGQKIYWHNTDTVAHTATSGAMGGWTTGSIAPGATSAAPITISSTGTVSYYCYTHPTQVGTLKVSP